jgi:saccharopine dehydrogenase-like NADP-dependent oxidoreductase
LNKRVLVLGATGHFGGRIVRALRHVDGIEVIAAARQTDRLQKLAAELALKESAITSIDAFQDGLASRIRGLGADIVIHTVGPFQGQSYEVARQCIAAQAHYIDLADGRSFVSDFSAALHAQASSANLLAVSGASTLPGLSSAVVDHYRTEFDSLEQIGIVIAPAQKTPRGQATIGAVLSYCGKPFQWMHDGRWTDIYGWQSLQRVSLPKLGSRWAAACDVPDLALLPQRYDGVRSVQFRAALELAPQHGGLWMLAALRRLMPSLPVERLAGPLGIVASKLDRFGSERGGMTIALHGVKDGKPKTLLWYLVAEQNQGPQIPCLAAELIARKLTGGELTSRGAMPCVGLLSLEDFTTAFKLWPYEYGLLDETA